MSGGAPLRRTVSAGVGGAIGITGSFGCAVYPDVCGEGSHWADLFSLADEAMYGAKRRGGDGVEMASRQEEPEQETEDDAGRDTGFSSALAPA